MLLNRLAPWPRFSWSTGGDTAPANDWYHAAVDSVFGVGNWDLYDLPEQGLPDPPGLFLGVLRQYEGVLWHFGRAGTGLFAEAAPLLVDYIQPDLADSSPGR